MKVCLPTNPPALKAQKTVAKNYAMKNLLLSIKNPLKNPETKNDMISYDCSVPYVQLTPSNSVSAFRIL